MVAGGCALVVNVFGSEYCPSPASFFAFIRNIYEDNSFSLLTEKDCPIPEYIVEKLGNKNKEIVKSIERMI